MKTLFYIKDSIENRISYYHLVCFLVTLSFDRFYSTLILISFLIHTIIHLKKNTFKRRWTEVLIPQSVFFISLLSSIYATSFPLAMDTVTRQLAIFLFPVLLNVNSLDIAKYRSKFLMLFALGVTVTIAWLYIDAIHVIRYQRLPLKTLFSPAFVNHNFCLPIAAHATYFSMLAAISLLWFLNEIIICTSKLRRIIFIACSIVLAAGLVQLSSKSVLIALLLIINIGIPWLLLKQKYRYRFLFISLSVTALLLVLIFSVNVFHERYLLDFKNDLFNSHESISENWRIDRWNASVTLISKSPVIGSGTGSETPLLKEIYFSRKMYGAYLNSLNVHNQFLSFLINSGIIGLLVYLYTLIWGFRKAIRSKDLLLLSFMVLVTVVSFSEDLLDVNKGIFFYAFFFPFLVLSQRKEQRDILPQATNSN